MSLPGVSTLEQRLQPAFSQALLELKLVSTNIRSGQIERQSRGSLRRGGPTGGIDVEGDRTRDWPIKSVEAYERRWGKAHSDRAKLEVLADLKKTIRTIRRAPDWNPGEAEPEPYTLRWRRMIAQSDEPLEVLAKRHEISTRTISRYREKYREACGP